MRPFLAILLLLLVGCGLTPQEEYDTALSILNRQQERLDALRPAYDAARRTAELQVVKEIAGVTPEESQTAALEQLQGLLGQSVDGQSSTDQPAEEQEAFDIDATIDQLLAGQQSLGEQQASLSASIVKANEVMQQIKTPGTPEAERYEEVLAAMEEVQAYRRQQERVERAQQAADAAEAALDDAAAE